ncbi:MAG TPA: TonB-dependent receptor, partial [Caldithrix abyssi]|nr:TonB-dependent receptor [Caldithrix abyssi]
QYTRGNADNPEQTFTRAGASMDPIPTLIPMSWDQRHTFNATVGYHKGNLGATLTGYYNSGTPYTWSPIILNPVSRVNLFPNNDYMPSSYSVDFFSYYKFKLFKLFDAQIELSIYNLFDRLNPVWVYGSTGQPYTTIIQESDRSNHRSDFNEYEDRIKNPSAYSAPRMVKLGIGFTL